MRARVWRTRWRIWRSWQWRAGLMRGEWWVGARRDFAMDVWVFGVLGMVLMVGHA